ncbi:hypothetical protein [Nocardioides sp. GXZ039]|uniref:hypothetical protein n=1 Tax=Nocardioides sp. GXZ039 TaxID=3136018 RepID=UPI0030F45FD8
MASRLKKDPESIEATYRAEVADQEARCRVDPYNDALAEALVRRVARALAMRNVPLGIQVDDFGSTRIGSTDPEVRRLEGPFRRLVVG